ncbi:hypothetical protein [Microvirga roseola]|uniref:hypothetical protein n=1 Tax=Microvirga roseola TaxID=2883126 RepID=UPI001E63D653|nr:hypothetical protein [Microvirga roseola]
MGPVTASESQARPAQSLPDLCFVHALDPNHSCVECKARQFSICAVLDQEELTELASLR